MWNPILWMKSETGKRAPEKQGVAKSATYTFLAADNQSLMRRRASYYARWKRNFKPCNRTQQKLCASRKLKWLYIKICLLKGARRQSPSRLLALRKSWAAISDSRSWTYLLVVVPYPSKTSNSGPHFSVTAEKLCPPELQKGLERPVQNRTVIRRRT